MILKKIFWNGCFLRKRIYVAWLLIFKSRGMVSLFISTHFLKILIFPIRNGQDKIAESGQLCCLAPTVLKQWCAHDSSQLSPCLPFPRSVCGARMVWGPVPTSRTFLTLVPSIFLHLSFVTLKKEKAVSSQGSCEVKIRSWMCKGLLDDKPHLCLYSTASNSSVCPPLLLSLPQGAHWVV